MYEEGIEFYQYLCIKKYRKICYSKIVIFVVFKNFKVLGSIKVMEIWNFVILRKENYMVIVVVGGEKCLDVEGKIDQFLKDVEVDASPSVLEADNKQLGVSLLNGVVFKIFFLEPAVKWEPNKLRDFIARQFQTEEDLSSVTSLVSNKDNIIKIVESVSTYTEVYKSFMKLKTLCCETWILILENLCSFMNAVGLTDETASVCLRHFTFVKSFNELLEDKIYLSTSNIVFRGIFIFIQGKSCESYFIFCNALFNDMMKNVAYCKMKEWILLNAKRKEFKKFPYSIICHTTNQISEIPKIFLPEEYHTFIASIPIVIFDYYDFKTEFATEVFSLNYPRYPQLRPNNTHFCQQTTVIADLSTAAITLVKPWTVLKTNNLRKKPYPSSISITSKYYSPPVLGSSFSKFHQNLIEQADEEKVSFCDILIDIIEVSSSPRTSDYRYVGTWTDKQIRNNTLPNAVQISKINQELPTHHLSTSSFQYSKVHNVPYNSSFTSLLINCKLRRSQSSLHTARRCIPNVSTYISNDHEHQNGIINSSLVGVIIGDWKFTIIKVYASIQSVVSGLVPHIIMNITCGLMMSQDRNLIRLFDYNYHLNLHKNFIYCFENSKCIGNIIQFSHSDKNHYLQLQILESTIKIPEEIEKLFE
ncbi:hypothetical protein H8356DRAFT_1341099 [Neocallimastix lanati (nom. inval.)]|nr:hypothetical protein H8356DRAFT_1341099 [Neocallimastix sp. JGI-2020a]